MTITLNHNLEILEVKQLTIADLLRIKKFSHHDLIIKINSFLIKHENYHEMEVLDGDNVEIIHLFYGGKSAKNRDTMILNKLSFLKLILLLT